MAIFKIQKRNGSVVSFDRKKIEKAIEKSICAVGGEDFSRVSHFADLAMQELESKKISIPTVENIQDAVEKILIKDGHDAVAKAYIVYREKRSEIRNTKNVVVEVGKTIDEYVQKSDWRVNANANSGYSLGGLILNTSGKMTANYWLSHVYPEEVGAAHRNADYHIHDLDMLCGYCAGWSLRQLLEEGFNGMPNRIESAPPKNLQAAVNQMINFLGTLQNEWAGAQAFSSFDTYLSPFVHKHKKELENDIKNFGMVFSSKEKKQEYIEKKTYEYVVQQMQNFIFGLNVPSRWGTQCVDETTECLTDSGWKKHFEISENDKICTFNLEKNCYEFLVPEKITAYDFDGEMYVLKNRTQEQWITPKHKVVRKVFNTKEKYILEEIEKIEDLKSPFIMLNSWETSFQKTLPIPLIQLLAWVVAEGNFDFSEGRKRVSIFQSEVNAKYIQEIRGILAELNFSFHERKREKSGFSENASYRFRLNAEESRKICEYTSEKIVPEVIKTLSADCIRLFLETYIKGDGHEEENGRVRIYTKDKKNCDALQELCVLSGWGSTVTKRENGIFVLNIIRNKETYIQKIERKKYTGKVWCPTTKNGTFVARRNGKTFITGNTPFTNITLDWTCPDDLQEKALFLGGIENGEYEKKYGELENERDMLNKALLEVYSAGDAKGRVFTFPIPTYNITEDFPWESENVEKIFEVTAKYGLPYFQNFIGSQYKRVKNENGETQMIPNEGAYKPGAVRSMCCRLQLDLRELQKRGNGLFGSAEMTGSIGVVTLNLARIGYQKKGDKKAFFDRIHHLMHLAKTSLEMKRKVLSDLLAQGLFPYTFRYLRSFRNHFSTIGINGMNEAILNFTDGKENISTDFGKNFAEEVLDDMRKILKEYQEETGNMYNLEATPAEGTTYRFAKEDQAQLPKILQAGTSENPYYTNSTQLPVDFTNDAFEALDEQNDLQCKYTGGTVLHLYMGERISSAKACKNFVKKVISNYQLPYITITPSFSICPKHGYLDGEHDFCPKCDAENGYTGAEKFDEEMRKPYKRE